MSQISEKRHMRPIRMGDSTHAEWGPSQAVIQYAMF